MVDYYTLPLSLYTSIDEEAGELLLGSIGLCLHGDKKLLTAGREGLGLGDLQEGLVVTADFYGNGDVNYNIN